MTPYDQLLSRMGAQLAGSAIRQMGVLAAGRPDLISFAPGYPDPVTFAWDAYRAIADDLLRAQGRDTLQYGATRGYGPLIESIVPRLRDRAIACTTEEVLLTTGSQQAVDLVARQRPGERGHVLHASIDRRELGESPAARAHELERELAALDAG